jgi:hypothetical protein
VEGKPADLLQSAVVVTASRNAAPLPRQIEARGVLFLQAAMATRIAKRRRKGSALDTACGDPGGRRWRRAKRPAYPRRRGERTGVLFRLRAVRRGCSPGAQVFPLRCPDCGAEMRILAFVTGPFTVAGILRHLELPATAPPLTPARSPPPEEPSYDADPLLDLDQTPVFDPTEPDPIPDFDFDQTRGA